MKKLILISLMLLLATSFQSKAQYSVQKNYGDTVTATIHPDPGWKFLGWYKDNVLLSTEITLTYIVTGDAQITAKLEQLKYNIEVIISPPNSGSISGIGAYIPNSQVELQAKNKLFWKFEKYIDEDGNTLTHPIQTFTADQDRKMQAVFSLRPWLWAAFAGLIGAIGIIGKLFTKKTA
jgi:hypothetical protein